MELRLCYSQQQVNQNQGERTGAHAVDLEHDNPKRTQALGETLAQHWSQAEDICETIHAFEAPV